jgi:hypothetical protein
MNKDLDDRLIPNGEYRDAQNISVGKSEDDDIGALENVLGNSLVAGSQLLTFNDQNISVNSAGNSVTIDGNVAAEPGMTIKGVDSSTGLPFITIVTSIVYNGGLNQTTLTTAYDTQTTAANDKVDVFFPLEVIGQYSDKPNNRIILFLTNKDVNAVWPPNITNYYNPITQAKNYIVSYTPNGAVPFQIVAQGAFFNFSVNYPMTGITMIENLLFFTDNNNQPRQVNVNTGINDATYYTNEDHISVAKYNPYKAIDLVRTTTGVAGGVAGSGSTVDPYIITLTNVNTAITVGMSVVSQSSGASNRIVGGDFIYVQAINGTSAFGSLVGGSGYTNATGVATTVSPVGGTGLTVDITTVAGAVTVVAIADAGSGYNIGDVITITGGGGNATITLTAVNAITLSPSAIIPLPVATDVFKFLTSTMTNESLTANWAGDPDFLQDKFVRFSYRFKFDDNEYSLMAPFSQIAFVPMQKGYFFTGDEDSAYQSTVVNWMENFIQQVQLFIPLPDPATTVATSYKIKEIEILYKESDALAVKAVESIEISDITGGTITDDNTNSIFYGDGTFLPSNILVYTYQSRKPYKTLPQAQTTRVYDKVPVKALAQESAGNRIIYGNFYNQHTPPSSINYQVGTVDKNTNLFNNWIEYPNHSIKQNRNYQVGFILADKYGRQSSVILSPVELSNTPGYGGSTVYVPYKSSSFDVKGWFGNALQVIVNEVIASSIATDGDGAPGLYAVQTNPLGFAISAGAITTVAPYTYTFTLDSASFIANAFVPAVGEYLRGATTDYVKVTDVVNATPLFTITTDGEVNEIYKQLTTGALADLKWAYTLNTLGWYSYKVVVRQRQQDYYNVYLPGILDGYPLQLSLLPITGVSSALYSANVTQIVLNSVPVGLSSGMVINSATGVELGTVNSFSGTKINITPLQASVAASDVLTFTNPNTYIPFPTAVPTFTLSNPGTLYATTTDVATTVSPAGGSGLTVDITAAGAITQVLINTNGSGYDVGDVLTITGGGGDATITITGFGEISKTANIVLFNDNINKVPRDLAEVGPEQKQFRSSVQLFGRVTNTMTTGTASNAQFYGISPDFARASNTVIAIGEARDLNIIYDELAEPGGKTNFYQIDTNPLIGRISTPTAVGVISTSSVDTNMAPYLAVYETEPNESLLDLYWETATEGLIADLNADVLTGFTGPASFTTLSYLQYENQLSAGLTGVSDSSIVSVGGTTLTLTSAVANLVSGMEIYLSDVRVGSINGAPVGAVLTITAAIVEVPAASTLIFYSPVTGNQYSRYISDFFWPVSSEGANITDAEITIAAVNTQLALPPVTAKFGIYGPVTHGGVGGAHRLTIVLDEFVFQHDSSTPSGRDIYTFSLNVTPESTGVTTQLSTTGSLTNIVPAVTNTPVERTNLDTILVDYLGNSSSPNNTDLAQNGSSFTTQQETGLKFEFDPIPTSSFSIGEFTGIISQVANTNAQGSYTLSVKTTDAVNPSGGAIGTGSENVTISQVITLGASAVNSTALSGIPCVSNVSPTDSASNLITDRAVVAQGDISSGPAYTYTGVWYIADSILTSSDLPVTPVMDQNSGLPYRLGTAAHTAGEIAFLLNSRLYKATSTPGPANPRAQLTWKAWRRPVGSSGSTGWATPTDINQTDLTSGVAVAFTPGDYDSATIGQTMFNQVVLALAFEEDNVSDDTWEYCIAATSMGNTLVDGGTTEKLVAWVQSTDLNFPACVVDNGAVITNTYYANSYYGYGRTSGQALNTCAISTVNLLYSAIPYGEYVNQFFTTTVRTVSWTPTNYDQTNPYYTWNVYHSSINGAATTLNPFTTLSFSGRFNSGLGSVYRDPSVSFTGPDIYSCWTGVSVATTPQRRGKS